MEELEVIVVPETPKYLGGQELYVYLPLATNKTKGIASFSQQFKIVNGQVQLLMDVTMKDYLGVLNRFEVDTTPGISFTKATYIGTTLNSRGLIEAKMTQTSMEESQIPLQDNMKIIVKTEIPYNQLTGITLSEFKETLSDYDIVYTYTDKDGQNYTLNIMTPATYNYTPLSVKNLLKYCYAKDAFEDANKMKFLFIATLDNTTTMLVDNFNTEYLDNLEFLTDNQKAALNSGATTDKINKGVSGYNNSNTNAANITAIQGRMPTFTSVDDKLAKQSDVTSIENKIPSGTTSENQMVNESRMQSFVNSSINSLAAFYITRDAVGDPFRTKAELNAATVYYSGGVVRVPTQNDYCIVQADESKAVSVDNYNTFTTTDQYVGYRIIYNYDDTLVTNDNKNSLGIVPGTTICYYTIPTTRYSYQNNQWAFLYIINDTSLTAAQLAAINSGVTSSTVAQVETNRQNILLKANQSDLNALQGVVNGKQDKAGSGTATLDFTDTTKWDSVNKIYTLDLSGTPWYKTVAKTNITLYKPMLGTKTATEENTLNLQTSYVSYVVDNGISIDLYFQESPLVNTLYIGVEVY